MIEIENLVYSYDPALPPVLDGVCLRIAEGEYLALIGPNGCGKTTLARHLNGLLSPTSGTVLVDGMDTRVRRNLPAIRKRVGMIFQNPENQIVGTTVEEDVAFGPGNLGLPSPQIRTLVDEALALVDLAGYETRHPHTLSGGEKQLLALAGILSMTPQYVILDEPTSSLDPTSRKKVLSIVKTLNDRGIAIIHITHSMEDVARADRIAVIDKGRVAAEGLPSDIFYRIDWLKSLGLAPPPVAELMWRLREGRDAGGRAVLTIDEAVEELMSFGALSSTGAKASAGEERP